MDIRKTAWAIESGSDSLEMKSMRCRGEASDTTGSESLLLINKINHLGRHVNHSVQCGTVLAGLSRSRGRPRYDSCADRRA